MTEKQKYLLNVRVTGWLTVEVEAKSRKEAEGLLQINWAVPIGHLQQKSSQVEGSAAQKTRAARQILKLERKAMTYYYAEVTDTLGGEANYCWVRRYKIKASTPTGAIRKMPGSWRKAWDSGDMQRYDCGSVCCFLEEWDEDQHGDYKVEEI